MSYIKMDTTKGIQLIPVETELMHKSRIFLEGNINSENCNEIIKQIMFISEQDDINEIEVFIDSFGGEVQAGLALYDVMRMIDKPIRTIILGKAASMGAIIFLAGSKREMLPHSKILIHDPSFSHNDVGGMKSHEIKAELEDLDRCREILANIIAERTGRKLKEIYKITAVDHYMDSDEAIKFGLADGIYENLKGDKNA